MPDQPHPVNPQTISNLSVGRKYRVHYTYQAGNYRWVERYMVATFLDVIPSAQLAVFSGRPEFGTQELPLKHILGVEGPLHSLHVCYTGAKVKK